jgi:hypothetical protein
LKWKFLVLSVAIIICVILISIGVSTYYGKISVDVGILLSVLGLVVPAVSTAIGYFLTPRATLEIKNLQCVKENFHGVEGHQARALITNNGRKICTSLDATFHVEDAEGRSPNVLHINVDETNGREEVTTREETMINTSYVWTDEKFQTIEGTSTLNEELRRGDRYGLLFPYETVFATMRTLVGSMSGGYSETLLKLGHQTYRVTVEVKGRDSDSNTVMKSKTVNFKP